MKPKWDEIREYYITHPECSQKDLLKKFDITKAALNDRSAKEKWVAKREAYQADIREKVEQKTKEQEILRRVAANEKHNDMYDKLLAAASNLLEVFEEAAETKKFNRATTAANLAYLAEVVQKAQKGQRTALNMDDESSQDTSPQIKFVVEGITLEDI